MSAARRALAFLGALIAGPALGAGSEAPPGALSCSGCHAIRPGTAGAIPAIHGRGADEIAAALAAFRSGARPATVMNRIATGFTPEESRAIAEWIARQEAPR